MGTNYYLKTPSCPHCGHKGNRLHIGKSSSGWFFGLRVYADSQYDLTSFDVAKIDELEDWRPLFDKFEIVNEYGEQISAHEMIREITERNHPRGLLSRVTAGPEHMGPYATAEHRGKPGKGTYDLCKYEFS